MIQKIEYSKENRVETGAVEFGDDWTGLFIRGDDACQLRHLLYGLPDKLGLAQQIIDIIEKDVIPNT